ncbi:hypothetical protein AB0H71_13805 [Nocardia sp. NPDC050697]|uniref:hypothetical protein n=1 Tax=Nocardia sp. NPDC050697 TaxID=3155158 RepID=UPI0033E22E46
MSAADDLNADFTAERWFGEDLSAIATAVWGSEDMAAWVADTWRDQGFGPAYAAASATRDLEGL